MKYLCLGYAAEETWNEMSEGERETFIQECFDYDDVLRKDGHFVRGEALQSGSSGATLRVRNGRLSVTDGPYAETREVLGGLLVLEAKDLNHAIQLMAQHPGLRLGPFDIRPIDEDFTARANDRSG